MKKLVAPSYLSFDLGALCVANSTQTQIEYCYHRLCFILKLMKRGVLGSPTRSSWPNKGAL